METKLKKCIALDIPVLVKLPNGDEAWAMDVQLGKLTQEDVVLSESDRINQRRLIWHFYDDEQFDFYRKPALDTSTLFASTLVTGVDFLQLHTHDVEKLSASEEVRVTDFKAVMAFDEETEGFSIMETVPVSKYRFKLDSFNESPTVDLLYQKFKFTDVDLMFVLIGEGIAPYNEFNFPIKHKRHVEVVASECYISEQDVSKLVFADEEYRKSIYHLEPEYHVSTSFVELSKAGYELFVKNVPVVSGGNSSYLRRNFSCFNKKSLSEGGAFWINSTPRGRFKGKGCQFNVLKSIFDEFWLEESALSKKKAQEVSEKIIIKLEQESEFNDDYIKSAEFIIRPDKYKT